MNTTPDERPTDYRLEQQCTATSLIARTANFVYMVPAADRRNAQALDDDPPRLYRFQQIEALLRAFNLNLTPTQLEPQIIEMLSDTRRTWYDDAGEEHNATGLEYIQRLTPFEFFFEGHFLMFRPLVEYREVILRLKPYWPFYWTDSTEGALVDGLPAHEIHHVQTIWEQLMQFRVEVERVIQYNSGVLMASDWYHCTLNATEAVCLSLWERTREIDDILAMLVDPQGRVFSREELIRHHAFPDVDLLETDCDWA